MADGSSDEYVPDESTLSSSDSSDLSHDSASDYSSASEDSFSGSEDENDTIPTQIWSRVYPPEEDIDFPSFLVRNPGPRDMPAANSTPIVYFLLFLTVEILGKIVTETKKYAAQFLGATDLSPRSRLSRFETMNFCMSVLKKYIGLGINMGLIKMKRTGMYWNKSNPCINTPFFNSVMSRNQFELITYFLHCCDNTRPEARRDNAAYDPLHKFRIVLDGLNNSCKRYYVPGQLTLIDESLIGMKNRTELMQYIPNKHHHKWGVKLYSITESSTGFPMHTMVYCGKRRSAPASEHGHSYDVVMNLLSEANLKNKGYHLFVDNFYTSPTLAQHLHETEVMLTGFLRPNRKGVPVIIRQAKPKVQECIYARKGPLLVLTWKEKKSQKKPCLMLSTGVSAEMVDHRRASGEVKQLPKVISLNNHHMGGVDLLDQKVDQYAGERGFHKYWKKCFFGVIDRMVVCSYILYNQNTSDTHKLSRFQFV